MAFSIKILNQITEQNHSFEIDALNFICSDMLSGVGGHAFNIQALNEICTLLGATSGHSYNIHALNAICTPTKFRYENEAWQYILDNGLISQSYPAVLNDGNTWGWYDFAQSATITKDGSNYVSEWADFLGSGHDLVQATAAKQPIWNATDGVKFELYRTSIQHLATLESNVIVYMVANIIYAENAKQILCLNAGSFLRTYVATNQELQILSSGTDPILATNPESLAIVRAVFGENTYVKVNANSSSVVPASYVADFGGVTVGCYFNEDTQYSVGMDVKEIIVRSGANALDGETDIYNYLKSKHGL